MPDSSAIDAALLTLLGGDATLLGLLANGAYWDVAPPGSTRFAIVSLIEQSDAQVEGRRAFEDTEYLVKGVVLTTVPNASTVIRDAAARIDALLDQTRLTATGYTPMICYRDSRVRYTEVDDVDPTIRWYHRGGQYRVVMST